MNLKKEKTKMKIYLILYVIFLVLTFVGAGFNILNREQANVGYAVIPMLFGLVFMRLYRECKKRIDDK